MSQQEAQVKVRITQQGAEETKQRLLETRAAMLGMSTEQLKTARTTRDLARDANILNNMERLKTRIWLAQNPVLNNLTRAMSTFGSVSRGVLAVTTAFSTAILAFNSTNNGLAQIQSELDQARREQALALEKYGYDSQEYADATEKVNTLESQFKELNDQLTAEKLTSGLNFAAMIGIIGQSINTVVQSGALVSLIGLLKLGLIPVLAAAAILAGVVAAVIGAIALAFYMALTPGDQFQEFVNTFFPQFAKDVEYVGKIIDDVFAMHIPNAFIFMANTALDVVDSVVGAVGGMVNEVIRFINKMIQGANTVASALGLPTLKELGTINISNITGGYRIPYLQSRNWGAGGAGTYSGGSTSSGGVNTSDLMTGGAMPHMTGGKTVIVNVHNAGSVISEMDLNKSIDKAVKQILKDHGWN